MGILSIFFGESSRSSDMADLHHLTATEALARIRNGELSVETYARALLKRIGERDEAVRAWAFLDPKFVIEQAKALDKVPIGERGPLHGVPIGVKDVIYTKDMPTQHGSPIYKDSFPKVDSASITILRHAGALIFGKTATTEFAATTIGPKTLNPHSTSTLPRTPGGSSSGSGAAVADLQIPLALSTQTGGSTIRPASFNGIYALKPTWGAVSREGQKIYALLLDTLGWYARSVDDLKLVADVLGVKDDEKSQFSTLKGARFGVCKTVNWNYAGSGTQAALNKAVELLQAHGAVVEDLELPAGFDALPEWHRTLLHTEGRAHFLPEHRTAKASLHESLAVYIDMPEFSRREQLAAQDGIAALRPVFDEIAGKYDAILTASAVDVAPVGLESTGDAVFCSMWTALHVPVVNVPGFMGEEGLPVGVSLVAGRFRDGHLLGVAESVGEVFEGQGGWKRVMP